MASRGRKIDISLPVVIRRRRKIRTSGTCFYNWKQNECVSTFRAHWFASLRVLWLTCACWGPLRVLALTACLSARTGWLTMRWLCDPRPAAAPSAPPPQLRPRRRDRLEQLLPLLLLLLLPAAAAPSRRRPAGPPQSQ
jgi:hypothetical protein